MKSGYRQEVLNVLLAQLLQERGVIAAPENVIRLGHSLHRKMPDVMVNFQGLRTIIEGEVDDQPNAREKALSSIRKRVEDGIAHIGIAVIYPAFLRNVVFNVVKQSLADCDLEIAIVTESIQTGFITGDVDYLESSLRHVFDHLVAEDVVAEAVATLEVGIDKFASTLASKPGDIGRVAEILGIRSLEEKPEREEED
jgi:hypothetical protein